MLYKNNGPGLKFPVRGDKLSWITFKEGESKELSELEAVNAELHGLVKVEVKAVESSISKVKVETKKIKSKKKKKGK